MSKFIIKKAKTGLMFNFVSSNGEVVATSEVYTTKKACKNGIASVQRNAESDVENLEDKAGVHVKGAKYETYKDKRGEFRFRLKATNGQIIAVGEGYKAIASCMNAIKSIKTNAKSAEVVDETKAEKADAKKPASKKPSGKAKKPRVPAAAANRKINNRLKQAAKNCSKTESLSACSESTGC